MGEMDGMGGRQPGRGRWKPACSFVESRRCQARRGGRRRRFATSGVGGNGRNVSPGLHRSYQVPVPYRVGITPVARQDKSWTVLILAPGSPPAEGTDVPAPRVQAGRPVVQRLISLWPPLPRSVISLVDGNKAVMSSTPAKSWGPGAKMTDARDLVHSSLQGLPCPCHVPGQLLRRMPTGVVRLARSHRSSGGTVKSPSPLGYIRIIARFHNTLARFVEAAHQDLRDRVPAHAAGDDMHPEKWAAATDQGRSWGKTPSILRTPGGSRIFVFSPIRFHSSSKEASEAGGASRARRLTRRWTDQRPETADYVTPTRWRTPHHREAHRKLGGRGPRKKKEEA